MDKHDKTRSWAVNRILDNIEQLHINRENGCRAGRIIRMLDGTRMYWVGEKPSDEEREAAKAAPGFMESHAIYCPCCKQSFRMASAYESVQEHGVCYRCLPFIEGKIDGVLSTRMPSLEEVLAVPSNDIRPMEAVVLQQECQRQQRGI